MEGPDSNSQSRDPEHRPPDEEAVSRPGNSRFPGLGGGIVLVLLLFALQLVAGLAIVIGSEAAGFDGPPAPLLALAYVISFGGTLIIGRRVSRSSFGEIFRSTPIPWSIIVPVTAVLFGVWVLIIEGSAFVTNAFPMSESMLELMRMLTDSPWVTIPLLSIAAPILEEGLFRGIVLRGLLERHDPWKAIVMSAFLFAAAHANVWQLPASLVTGVFFGWLYFRTRSLLLCILLHAAHNFTFSAFGRYVENVAGASSDAATIPFVPWWVVAAGVILLVAGIYMTEKRLESFAAMSRADAAGRDARS